MWRTRPFIRCQQYIQLSRAYIPTYFPSHIPRISQINSSNTRIYKPIAKIFVFKINMPSCYGFIVTKKLFKCHIAEKGKRINIYTQLYERVYLILLHTEVDKIYKAITNPICNILLAYWNKRTRINLCHVQFTIR